MPWGANIISTRTLWEEKASDFVGVISRSSLVYLSGYVKA